MGDEIDRDGDDGTIDDLGSVKCAALADRRDAHDPGRPFARGGTSNLDPSKVGR